MKNSPTAMILAAGLGTRLKPFSNTKPKALMEYKGKSLLQRVIENLTSAGFNHIIINIHHFGDKILDHISKIDIQNAKIDISDERDKLMNIGGGLKKASRYFTDNPVLVHNVDIYTNLDLKAFYDFHVKNDAPATMAVKERETSRSLLSNSEDILCGWRNNKTGEEEIVRKSDIYYPVAFSGIYVIDPDFCDMFQREGSFPVMPEILRIAKTHNIRLYPHNQDFWQDLGKPEAYQVGE